MRNQFCNSAATCVCAVMHVQVIMQRVRDNGGGGAAPCLTSLRGSAPLLYLQILSLRQEKAKLLGYSCFADLSMASKVRCLQPRMIPHGCCYGGGDCGGGAFSVLDRPCTIHPFIHPSIHSFIHSSTITSSHEPTQPTSRMRWARCPKLSVLHSFA